MEIRHLAERKALPKLWDTVAAARGVTAGRHKEPSRTDLAEDRTILASERTFAGWIRTGLGCIAIGAGIHALLGTLTPTWVPRTIATWFLLVAMAICWLALLRAAAVRGRLDPHVVASAPMTNLKLVAVAVSTGATALIAAIWLVPG